ncbi:MAG: hypothetical protein IIC56_06785, partial [Proteobacteria bacterium]|nr:hypothetical protein [Pseudomonadota bacterium]
MGQKLPQVYMSVTAGAHGRIIADLSLAGRGTETCSFRTTLILFVAVGFSIHQNQHPDLIRRECLMALVIAILAMIAGLAGLFLSGTTLNKMQTANEKMTTEFRSEIKIIKNAIENKLSDLEERLSTVERNPNP